MLGNFTYANPTRIHFGENALDFLNEELPKFGKNVLLAYGGGSIRKNGIYDRVVDVLRANGKTVLEDAGVMPNPTVAKLNEGCRRAREGNADLILAVGGGSVCDYAKAVSASAWCGDDPWEKFFVRMEEPDNRIIPVGCVLTMVGTGSEMNGGSVISNPESRRKIGHVFGDEVFPKFSILNPTFTFTLPRYQMVAGFFDIMSHILEQYSPSSAKVFLISFSTFCISDSDLVSTLLITTYNGLLSFSLMIEIELRFTVPAFTSNTQKSATQIGRASCRERV